MVPEILLIGDEDRRSRVIQQIRALGHEVEVCPAAQVERRLQGQVRPAVVIVCAADVDPKAIMATLRRQPAASGAAVVVFGSMGADHDLADVLDLGADHFVEDNGTSDELATILKGLTGPASRGSGSARGATVRSRGWGGGTEVLDGSEENKADASLDPNIGRLHRTLDILEARLRARESGTPRDRFPDDVELSRMGLDEVPEVEAEVDADILSAADSHDRMPVAAMMPLGEEDTGGFRVPSREPPETTTRLRSEADAEPLPSSPESDQVGRRAGPVDAVLGGDAGRLESTDVPRVLWRLHRARFTGKLVVERGRVRKEMWLEQGAVVFVRSNLSRDRLVDNMLRRGLLTRGQYETARRLAAKEPRRAGQVLMDAGFVKPGEFHDMLRDHLVSTVVSTFPWQEGEWSLEHDASLEEPIRVNMEMPALIVHGMQTTVGSAQLRQAIGSLERRPRLTAAVRSIPGGVRGLAEELGLDETQERWVGHMDAKRQLRELLADFEGEDEKALGLLRALLVMDLAELLEEPEPETRADPEQIDRERILERLALVRQADYYQVLGLHRDATKLDVRRAHAELLHTFSDETLEPPVSRELAEELYEIRVALDEAVELLSDDVLRAAYLAHLEDG